MSGRLCIITCWLSVLLSVSTPKIAISATVTAVGQNASGATLVELKGPMVKGDGQRFLAVTARLPDVIVILESPGGLVTEALTIGQIIQARAFATAVTPKAVCASACGIIWLYGRTRYLANEARVGFHALSDAARTITGNGNAVLGANLASLGLGFEAISFVTTAPPQGMLWMTSNKAESLNIAVVSPAPQLLEAVSQNQPAQEFPRLQAVIPKVSFGCDKNTEKTLFSKAKQGTAVFKAFISTNQPTINANCQVFKASEMVTIEDASSDDAMVCAKRASGAACFWVPVPTVSVLSGNGPAVQQAVKAPAAAQPLMTEVKPQSVPVAAVCGVLRWKITRPERSYEALSFTFEQQRKKLGDGAGGKADEIIDDVISLATFMLKTARESVHLYDEARQAGCLTSFDVSYYEQSKARLAEAEKALAWAEAYH